MNQHQTLLNLIGLGGVAGVIPVYLGIVVAIVISRMMNRGWEGYLTGIATGILVYLFFDLMHEAVELTGATDPTSWAVFLGSLLVSFVGLVMLEQRQQSRNRPEASSRVFLPYMIALGMGLHNLGEGLAIGASYSHGSWVLSGVLVGGFALHNGTEGFAIVGSAGPSQLRVKDAALMGLLAGGPTVIGTLISGFGIPPYLSIMFYSLAAGSLLYVIFSFIAIFYTATRRVQTATGVFTGVALMYITAMVLTLVTGGKT